MDARKSHAVELAMEDSKSLAGLRFRPSHAKVLSTILCLLPCFATRMNHNILKLLNLFFGQALRSFGAEALLRRLLQNWKPSGIRKNLISVYPERTSASSIARRPFP